MSLNRIIVVGASIGGIKAICELVRDLPNNLPAATFVVQHVWRTSSLALILQQCHPNGCVMAADDGELIQESKIYVAVPNYHLVLKNGLVRLQKSPRENYHRPAIDVLFRSAARAYGPKVVGIILTGSMDDGISGLFAIKARGGITVVQDPNEALVPEMPLNALKAVDIDYCLPLAKIPPLIEKLAYEPVAKISGSQALNVAMTDSPSSRKEGQPNFVCPECNGPLTRYQEGGEINFSCKIGHRFSLQSLSEAHEEALERGLWTAVRTLSDRAAIQRERAVKFYEEKNIEQANIAQEIANQAEHDAQMLCEIIERL
jgi:two-component system, chemotaxis family, protein-glutamate methylesterase/glutaminase